MTSEGLLFTAVCDTNAERAQHFARRYGAQRIETDYEKINQDYALVLEEAGDCKAYIRVIYEDEES